MLYTTEILLNFAKKLEHNNIVAPETGIKIRSFIRKTESATLWELFLVISGVCGALFASAGIYSIIAHNWYDLAKSIRGIFSIVPVAAGLYFYYLALFKHKDSKVWIEASSLFLMLMVGASMFLVSQTYNINGDFLDFVKIWLALTVPLFYLAKASIISLFYLGLTCILLTDIRYEPDSSGILPFVSDGLYWFWLYLLAFIPHYYLAFNKSKTSQGLRVIVLSLALYLVLIAGLAYTVKSNYILWFFTFNVGVYLFGKRYMRDNMYFLMRPLQVLPQLSMVFVLLVLSNKWLQYGAMRMDSVFNYEDWDGEETTFFILMIVVLAGFYYNFLKDKAKFGQVNYLVIFTPGLILLSMIMDEFIDSWWWASVIINFYILFLGITTIIHGSTDGRVAKMVAGLAVVVTLLGIRYFDNDLGYISRGIVFLGVGGMFFLINLLVKDKVEDIDRHKRLS